MAYPTPPPTSSPKQNQHDDYPYPRYPISSETPQRQYDSYPTASQFTQPSPSQLPTSGKLPAQDSYFQDSYPTPSPSGSDPLNNPYQYSGSTHQAFSPAEYQQQQQHSTHPLTTLSPRPASPLIHGQQPAFSPQPPYSKPSKPHRRTPSPRPIYFSPTNRPPSPYSANRPKPRPGFVRRILDKIASWIRAFTLWAQSNPIKAGVLTFIPVAVGTGMVKLVREVGKGLGVIKSGKAKEKLEKERDDLGTQARELGFDKFVKFNGSKGGIVDGLLKILQMWM